LHVFSGPLEPKMGAWGKIGEGVVRYSP